MNEIAGLDLQTASFQDLAAAMAAGALTSAALTRVYLERIAAYDTQTNAIRELNPQAESDAEQLDRERAAGALRGPLHGLPLLLKDNIGTAGMPTTAGSLALAGSVPFEDSCVAARLRAAGAVLLGKTNLSEFANWMDESMPNGYSSLGGQVRSAYGLGDPSGSSSGSAVAASLALAAGTVGSETSGSILSPSDVNGLVGVKPTRGLVSRGGMIPLAEGFDTPGPMTRSVADAAALLTAMAGTDARDPATADADSYVTDYVAALDEATLTGVRLGYQPGDGESLSDQQQQVYEAALADLRRLGAVLVATTALAAVDQAGELALIPNDFKAHLDHYLSHEIPVPASGVCSLADVIAFNDRHPEQVRYGQGLLRQSADSPGDRQLAARQSLDLRTEVADRVDAVLAADGLAAIVTAGSTCAHVGAAAGYPSVIVPAGLVDGVTPMGLSFLGTAWSEAALLRYAAAYEAGSRRRVPPANPLTPSGC